MIYVDARGEGTSSFFFIRILATSAVDLETDKAIQEIIRGPQFASMTMLIIAYVSFSP